MELKCLREQTKTILLKSQLSLNKRISGFIKPCFVFKLEFLFTQIKTVVFETDGLKSESCILKFLTGKVTGEASAGGRGPPVTKALKCRLLSLSLNEAVCMNVPERAWGGGGGEASEGCTRKFKTPRPLVSH